MISELETRLAEVLGTRIAQPFQGGIAVAAANAPGAHLVLGVTSAETLDPDLGSVRRTEVLPGSALPRRAVRLRCTLSLQGRSGPADRQHDMLALDAALYALDDPEFRNGSVLTDDVTDRGFRIDELQPAGIVAPLAPAADAPVVLRVTATGLFWPVGVEGKAAGKKIGEVRVRGAVLPLEIAPADVLIIAGGANVALTIRLATNALLAVRLLGAGGKPPAGTLAGAQNGIQLVTLTNGEAIVTYQPPGAPATDEMVVSFDDGEGGAGAEIGRMTLRSRTA
jgi:hypothetical protein